MLYISAVEATRKTHIVVLGAGFGGMAFCKQLMTNDVVITLVDRTNYHLFQPLLYQVATCGLAATDIAQPIRTILSENNNLTVLLDKVEGFDLANKKVILDGNTLAYDYLVLALGGQTGYFGHAEWEEFAPGLKTLDDALRIRSRVLLSFERAENEMNTAEHDKLMTVVIVGGGPTGVELAGSFAELTRTVLHREFRRIDPSQSRIILIEGAPNILGHLPADLSASARRQLESLGVEVRTSTQVKNISEGQVELVGGHVIKAANILWAAGVSASPLSKKLGVPLDRGGRVKVNPDLSLPGHPEVFAIGDLAAVMQANGKPVPGVSPAAMQMGQHVARILTQEIRFKADPATRPAFKYRDKGTMATIGRSSAVAQLGPIKLTGIVAWMAWLVVHIVFLVGFRNRAAVIFQWGYSYFSFRRSARIITYLPRQDAGTRPLAESGAPVGLGFGSFNAAPVSPSSR